MSGDYSRFLNDYINQLFRNRIPKYSKMIFWWKRLSDLHNCLPVLVAPDPVHPRIFSRQFLFSSRGQLTISSFDYLVSHLNDDTIETMTWRMPSSQILVVTNGSICRSVWSNSFTLRRQSQNNSTDQIVLEDNVRINVSVYNWHCSLSIVFVLVFVLRYESSTLILYKELSSSIFQNCQSVSE